MRAEKRFLILVGLLVFMLIGGCGGGGGGGTSSVNPTPVVSATLSGTAATGAPIAGTVTVKDSSATPVTKTVTIASDGTYTVDVTGMTAPFMLSADGTAVSGYEVHLCSAATQTDIGTTVNITPFTEIIVGNVVGTTAISYLNSGNISIITAAKLSAQQTALQTALQPVIQALGLAASTDLLHTSFSANGTGIDALLDVVKVATDSSTQTATIQNVITGQTITANFSPGAINGTLNQTTGMSSGLTEIDAIKKYFANASSLFATGLPSPTNPTLLAAFDASTFMNDGENLSAFISDITSSSNNNVGIQFANLTIQTLNSAQTSAKVSYNLSQNGVVVRPNQTFYMVNKNGVWLGQGDQMITRIKIYSFAGYAPGGSPQINTGVSFQIFQTNGVASAVISGPGITGSARWSVPKNSNDNALGLNGQPGGRVYNMNSTAGQASTGAVYTIKLYDSSSNLLATYNIPLAYHPYALSDLSAPVFPTISASTLTQLGAFRGGSIIVNWTLPSTLLSTNEVAFSFANSVYTTFYSFDSPGDFSPLATSLTGSITPPTSYTPTSKNLWIAAYDQHSTILQTYVGAQY